MHESIQGLVYKPGCKYEIWKLIRKGGVHSLRNLTCRYPILNIGNYQQSGLTPGVELWLPATGRLLNIDRAKETGEK